MGVKLIINGKEREWDFPNMGHALAFAFQFGECHNAQKVELICTEAKPEDTEKLEENIVEEKPEELSEAKQLLDDKAREELINILPKLRKKQLVETAAKYAIQINEAGTEEEIRTAIQTALLGENPITE